MTMCAFRHLHALILSVFSLSLPHGAVGNNGGQNCIGNSWRHNGQRNVPSVLGNNDAICSADQKTRLFFDGQRCRLTYRQCDGKNNCRDYHPPGPTKNCVSGGLAILQQNGDIKVYSNGAAFWWKLSAETGVFGGSFKPPVRDYYNKSKMIMGNDGNIEITVDGEVNGQLVWSYTSRTRTAGFKCEGSTLTSTRRDDDGVFGGDSTDRPSKVGYCTDSKSFGLFFDRETCQLKFCRTTTGSQNPCNEIYHFAPAKKSPPCFSGRAKLLYNSGQLAIYRDQGSSSPTILSIDQLPGDFYQQPDKYYDSSRLTVRDTTIEINVSESRGTSLLWRVTHKSPNAGFECEGSTLSTPPTRRGAVFGGYRTNNTNRPNKVGYCTNDKSFGIFFDRGTCQLKFCRTLSSSKNPCNEIYLVAPQSYQSPCYGGRAELLYSGELVIYRDQGTSLKTILSAAQLPGNFYQPQIGYNSSQLNVTSSSIEINNMYKSKSIPPFNVWRFTYNTDTNTPFTCLANSLSTQVGSIAIFGDGRNKVGYCTRDKTHGIYFDKEYCQLHLCKTVTLNNYNTMCNVIYDSTPKFSSCYLKGKAELSSNGDLTIYDSTKSIKPRWQLSKDGKFGDAFIFLFSDNFQIAAKLNVVSSGIITVAAQTQVWSSDSVGATLPRDGRTMDCLDNDNEMLRLRNKTCQQHLRNEYNNNRHNACGDLINRQAVKNLCQKSCYTGVCNHMQPRNTCYDSPKTVEFGISSCESQINNCFSYVDNGTNTLVRDYCRYTCKVDMDCNLDLL